MIAISDYLKRWRLTLSTAKTTATAFHLNNRDTLRQLEISINGTTLPNNSNPVYLGVTLDRSLTYKRHIEHLRGKITTRNGLLRCLAGSSWGACTTTLRTGALALVYSAAEYASPVWCRSSHAYKLDCALNDTMRIITGCLRPTPTVFLPVLSGVEPPDVRREARVGRLVNAARTFPGHILHDCVIAATSIGRQRLKSRHSFSNHAARLLKKPFEAALAWNDRVHNGPPLLQSACPRTVASRL